MRKLAPSTLQSRKATSVKRLPAPWRPAMRHRRNSTRSNRQSSRTAADHSASAMTQSTKMARTSRVPVNAAPSTRDCCSVTSDSSAVEKSPVSATSVRSSSSASVCHAVRPSSSIRGPRRATSFRFTGDCLVRVEQVPTMQTYRRVALLIAIVVLGACGGGAKSASSKASSPTNRGRQSGAPAIAAPEPPSSSPSTTTSTSTSSSRPATRPAPAVADPCAVGPQTPPPSTLPADFATALAFAPDGRLFFAERSGTVRVYQNGVTKTFATVSTVTSETGGGYSERGLLGLAISPTFGQDRFVYAFYSDADRTRQHVVRWRDCAGSGTDAKNIIDLPSGSDCCHKGGRLAFGPDGKLYVTLGDEHASAAAQNTGDVRGKILRYNPDGTAPSD